MISSDEAMAVAKKHGLSLSDAAAIHQMAATVDQAEQLAEQWVAPADPEQLADSVYRAMGRVS